MQKALVAAIVGLATTATITGLGVASGVTADLTLMVDGDTSIIRVMGGQTVGDVLTARDITVASWDFVQPDESTVVTDGLEIQVAHARPFTATIDGQTLTVTTTAATVDGALVTLGVDPAAADVSLPPETTLARMPMTVTVTTLKMVSLRVDGGTLYAQTPASTVADLLASRNITLGSLDRVTPDLDTPLTDNMQVVVQRVSTIMKNATTALPYKTKKVNAPKLAAGKTKVVTPGVKGKADQVWQLTFVDGLEETRKLISQSVAVAPVTKVVQVGTKGAPKQKSAPSSSPTVPAPTPKPGSAKDIALQLLPSYGFSSNQFGCLVNLWNRESHWNVHAQNRSSGAYGIPQALPGSKMASAGPDWRNNATTQIKWGLGYIKGRYGSPCAAWSHSQRTGWY